MNDTYFTSTHDSDNASGTRPPLRRTTGPIGGVAAALANTFNVSATGVRIALAAGAIFSGGAVVLGYIVAWMLIPIDDTLLESEKPASVPGTLLAVVAAIIGIQILFGLASSMPIGWIAIGALATWWFLRRR